MISIPTKSISKISTRDKEIIEYSKTHTLQKTGEKFNISAERVRQVKNLKHQHRCRVHNRLYFNVCAYCLLKKYAEWILFLPENILRLEAEMQAKNKNRDFLHSQYRAIIVKQLRDTFNYSFPNIARLLNKDVSTVTYLYNEQSN